MGEQFIVPKEPRLEWKTLFPSSPRSETALSLSGKPIQHLFWARNAIYHGLSILGLAPGDNVLVPAFHCTSIVEAILQYGVEVKFYDINPDTSPDFDNLRSQIDPRTRAVVIIHYFGFPQPIQKFRELCQQRKLFLIEDCAHVLTGRTGDRIGLGDSGDISVFSWRKFLPIYDGGQLVVNNPALRVNLSLNKGSFLFRLKIAKNTLERAIEDSRGDWWRRLSSVWNAAVSSLSKCLALVCTGVTNARQVNSYEVEFDINCVNLAMSRISRNILARTNITDIADKRRRNYARLAHAVKNMPGAVPLYPNLPDSVCPWVFPFMVPEVRDFQLLLRAKGIPATSWGAVIHPSLPLEEFQKARFLYDHVVFLPIHQSLDERDLETIIRIVGETLRDECVVIDAQGLNDCVPLSAFSGR